MRRLALVTCTALLALPACTSGGEKRASPSPTPAAARLALLARKASDSAYDATYRFVAATGGASGTLRIRQIPPDYRLDITLGPTIANYYATSTGVVSCTKKFRRAWDCFVVARPGEAVPALFDPGVQHLFRDAVADLAAHPDDYLVSVVAPSPSPSGSPSGSASPSVSPSSASPSASPTGSAAPLPDEECFAVERRSTPAPGPSGEAPAGFETGTYCFAADGMPTRFDVKTGLIVLRGVGPEPVSTDFTPPVKPKTLPSLSASPPPSPSR